MNRKRGRRLRIRQTRQRSRQRLEMVVPHAVYWHNYWARKYREAGR